MAGSNPWEKRDQSVLFLLDHSRSQGDAGLEADYDSARAIRTRLGSDASIGFVAVGSEARLL